MPAVENPYLNYLPEVENHRMNLLPEVENPHLEKAVVFQTDSLYEGWLVSLTGISMPQNVLESFKLPAS